MEMTRRGWLWRIACLALSTVVGCSTEEGDDWLAYRPDSALDGSEWAEIPTSQYSRVAESERERALALLTDRVYVALTAEQLEDFSAGSLAVGRGTPFLVRAVRTSFDSGDFELYSDSESLVVRYGTLGDNGGPVHDSVVVVLAREPAKLFVELSQAE
jgi:hypothetical protein